MIKIDPKKEQIPSEYILKIQKIHQILVNKLDVEKLKREGIIEDTNLFHKENTNNLEDSFTIKYQFIYEEYEEEDQIHFYVEEITILESEDEFFEEYARLKSLKNID